MNRESHYVINVAKYHGTRTEFYFRVEETSEKRAREIASDLTVKFLDCSITVTYWECSGSSVCL